MALRTFCLTKIKLNRLSNWDRMMLPAEFRAEFNSLSEFQSYRLRKSNDPSFGSGVTGCHGISSLCKISPRNQKLNKSAA